MVLLSQTLRARLTTCLAAAALAVTSLSASTTPARASDDAVVKFLLGATAIAIIAAGTSKSRSNPPKTHKQHAAPRHHHAPKTHSHRSRHAVLLPQHCATRYRAHGKTYRAYQAGCLHHAGLRRLPSACLISTRSGHVYGGHCLSQHGYQRR